MTATEARQNFGQFLDFGIQELVVIRRQNRELGVEPDPEEVELEEAWVREADERMMAFRDGKIFAVNGPQAMADLRAKFVK